MTSADSDTDELATLPDHIQEGLRILFVGLNPSQYSVEVGHYFANPRNRFWPAFNLSGLVDRQVTSQEDAALLNDGIGFTDVAKRPTPMGSGLKVSDFRQWAPVLKDKIIRFAPRMVCFHGLMAYRAYLQHAEGVKEKSQLGLQERKVGTSAIFVVPNPSPANAKYSLHDLAEWYCQLREANQQ